MFYTAGRLDAIADLLVNIQSDVITTRSSLDLSSNPYGSWLRNQNSYRNANCITRGWVSRLV
jgi:hypothetical protein